MGELVLHPPSSPTGFLLAPVLLVLLPSVGLFLWALFPYFSLSSLSPAFMACMAAPAA